MINKGKRNVLGVMINAIDYSATVEQVINAAHQNTSMAVTALAVHGVMMGALDAVHRYRLNHLDLVLPDGQPVRWGLNLLYRTQLRERVYGPTLMLKICERAAQENVPIALYGSRTEVLDALVKNLNQIFPQLKIAFVQPSHFRTLNTNEKDEVAQALQESEAKIIFVGLGAPRQEVWLYEHLGAIAKPTIAVGAAFDFHAKKMPQAPNWMQDWGLEWFFRLLHEPRRLWRRYLLLNPLYIVLILLQILHIHTLSPDKAVLPESEVRYG